MTLEQIEERGKDKRKRERMNESGGDRVDSARENRTREDRTREDRDKREYNKDMQKNERE